MWAKETTLIKNIIIIMFNILQKILYNLYALHTFCSCVIEYYFTSATYKCPQHLYTGNCHDKIFFDSFALLINLYPQKIS